MKKLIMGLLLMIAAVSVSAQLKYVPGSFRCLSFQAKNGDMGKGDVTYEYLKAQWPMDDNGSPAALLIVKFRNMLPEESRKFVTYFSAGCNKAAEEFPAADKHPEAYWLYVTAGDLIEITFNNPGHGACKVGPFKLGEKKIYEIVLENEKMQDISFNSIPGGATVMLDGEYVGVTPCEKKQATYGKHTVALTLDGLTKEEEINVSDERAYFDYDMRKTHSMSLSSELEGTLLEVDGKPYGRLPRASVILSYGPHTLVAVQGNIRDTLQLNVNEHSRMSHNFSMKEKKAVAIFAKYGGENVEADIDINNERLDNCKTPYTVNLPYGMHDISVSYMGRSNSKRFKVGPRSASICSIELPGIHNDVRENDRQEKTYVAKTGKRYWKTPEKRWLFGVTAGYVYKAIDTESFSNLQVGARVRPSFGGRLGWGLDTGIYYERGFGDLVCNALYIPIHAVWPVNTPFSISAGLGMQYDSYDYEVSNLTYGSGYNYSIDSVSQFALMAELGCNYQLKKFMFSFSASYGGGIAGDGDYAITKISLGLSYAF